MNLHVYRLLLALVGLVALVVVMLVTAYRLERSDKSSAAAWTRGGAVTLAVSGLYKLLSELGQPS